MDCNLLPRLLVDGSDQKSRDEKARHREREGERRRNKQKRQSEISAMVARFVGRAGGRSAEVTERDGYRDPPSLRFRLTERKKKKVGKFGLLLSSMYSVVP